MTTLEILIVVIVLLWLVGALVVPIGSSLVHVLLVVVLVLLIVRVVQGRRI